MFIFWLTAAGNAVVPLEAITAAEWLIDVVNEENNRGYVVIQSVDSLFRIIDRGITYRENAEQLKHIRQSLNVLKEVDFWIFKLQI